MHRRQFVARASAALAAGTLGCPLVHAQAGEETRFAGVTLRVATWGGATRDALRDHVAVEIEKRGGKVEFVIGSPQDNLAKLIAARGQAPFDVYEFLGTMRPEIEARGLLAKLNMANIPTARGLPGVPAGDLMVPTWITQEMIIYNPDRFRENGIPVPVTLSDLRNPKLAGRIMIPDISSGGGIEMVGAFALTAGGDETNITPGLQMIRSLPDARFWKAGGEVVNQFKSGDIWVAMAHAGWALRSAKAGASVKTVPPRIGNATGLLKEGYVGVVKGSRQQAAAEFFIRTYLTEQAQYEFALKTAVVPVVAEARARMSSEPMLRELLVLDAARIQGMVRLNPAKIDLSKWNDEWNRTVTR
jgi:putative spermidine/putrescine transport system substrate-binding protein